MGFDLVAAESVINFKKEFNISLIACIPCLGQESGFSENNKKKYTKILENCSQKIVLSDKYYDGCMFVRDRFMVDNCDVLITYQRRKSGGTFYTVNYAKTKGKSIIEL